MTDLTHAELVASAKTTSVLVEVRDERERQNGMWGEQNHPDGTSTTYASQANAYRANTDAAQKNGTLTFRHILVEELFEALAEVDPAALRAELVQVAAVAVSWVEKIDRDIAKASAVALPDPMVRGERSA